MGRRIICIVMDDDGLAKSRREFFSDRDKLITRLSGSIPPLNLNRVSAHLFKKLCVTLALTFGLLFGRTAQQKRLFKDSAHNRFAWLHSPIRQWIQDIQIVTDEFGNCGPTFVDNGLSLIFWFIR